MTWLVAVLGRALPFLFVPSINTGYWMLTAATDRIPRGAAGPTAWRAPTFRHDGHRLNLVWVDAPIKAMTTLADDYGYGNGCEHPGGSAGGIAAGAA